MAQGWSTKSSSRYGGLGPAGCQKNALSPCSGSRSRARLDFALQHPERVSHEQPTGPNPLDHRDDFSRPALRHASLNSLSISTLPVQHPPFLDFTDIQETVILFL